MRTQAGNAKFQIRAIGGSHVVLLAIDATPAARHGLLGFAIARGKSKSSARWLEGIKVFREIVPRPKPGARYSSLKHPIQSFLWGDYTAQPGKTFTFIIRSSLP